MLRTSSEGLIVKASDFYYLDNYEKAILAPLSLESAPFLIGSYCFLGEHDKARSLFKQYEKSFSVSQKVFSLFHLGISYTRTSEYIKAKEIFYLNWNLRHSQKLGASEKFLIYQGLSFFRYFFSKHESSLAFAKKAEMELLRQGEQKIPLYEALVQELIGHNFYNLGRPAKGEVHLKKALAVAKENHFDQLRQELEANLLVYQSQFDLDLDKNIEKLKKLLVKTSELNDYTSAEIVLQISKLYLLKGQFKKANDFLLHNFNIIYKNDNKRKVAILNTILAQILLPKQQYMEALSLLKVAKKNLDDDIDINLLTPILGIEAEILNILNQDAEEVHQKIQKLVSKTDKAILNQIQQRQEKSLDAEENKEDALDSLFNKVKKKDLSCLEVLIENKFFYLVPRLFEVEGRKKVIIIHPKNEGLFLVDDQSIQYSENKLSKSQIKFLLALSSEIKSKESLIKEVWGYKEYDPFRHDHLVYATIKRVRKAFDDKGTWIMALGDDQFGLDPEVTLIIKTKTHESSKTKPAANDFDEFPEDLNFRQVKLLEGVLGNPFSSTEVAEYFKITRMTSFRDLVDLVDKGFLYKRGKHKSTRYYLK